MMLLNWMMKEDYSKMKERAGYRGEWPLGIRTGLGTRKAENQEERKKK